MDKAWILLFVEAILNEIKAHLGFPLLTSDCRTTGMVMAWRDDLEGALQTLNGISTCAWVVGTEKTKQRRTCLISTQWPP